MLVNENDLKAEEINSWTHKVRAIIFNKNGLLYITDMNNSFNLPGGRVESKEDENSALLRELQEELGVLLKEDDIEYIDTLTFWHKGFPEEEKLVNRENKVTLFRVLPKIELNPLEVKLTNYEKHYNFKICLKDINKIDEVIKESSFNSYKKFTDIELKVLVETYLKYRKEDKIC